MACRDAHWEATGARPRGENHPSWIGDAAKLSSKRQRALNIRKREAPPWCESCGFMLVRDVHHKNGDPTDNRRENFAYLCMTCHALAHLGETVWWPAGVQAVAA